MTKSVAWLRNVLFNVRFTVEKNFQKTLKKNFFELKKAEKSLCKPPAHSQGLLKNVWKISEKKVFQDGKNCWNQAIWKKLLEPGNMEKKGRSRQYEKNRKIQAI